MPRGLSWQPQTNSFARACPRHSVADMPTRGGVPRACTILTGSLRQRKYRECSAECRVVAKGSVSAHGAEASSRLSQAGRKADSRPPTDAGQYRHVLFAAVLIGRDVSNDSGWGLELIEFFARLCIDSLEIAFERSVEHNAAGGRERTRPDRELLVVRPDDLARFAVPSDKGAHVGIAGRRIHRECRPYIGLARRIAHLERLIVHADVVRRNI